MANRALRVVVVGAGVGGLALARGLVASGHEVSVLEKAPSLRLAGAAVSIWFNGAAALGRLGVSLASHGQRIDRLDIRRPDGRVLAAFDAARLAGRFGVQAVTIPRRDLLERLAAGLPRSVLHFDVRCLAASQDEREAIVELEDGTTLSADLVVGADGWRSVVRPALGHVAPLRPQGIGAWQIMIPMPEIAAGHDFLYMVGREGGLRAGFMPAGHGLVQSWFDTAWEYDKARPEEILPRLRSAFAAWPAPSGEVLEAASEADVELWQYVSRAVPKTLGRGRLVLVGDAAHTMPPYLAQGANQALEDAWVLSDQLARGTPVSVAVQNYSSLRRRKLAMVSGLATSPVAASSMKWVDRLTPRAGAPERLTTALYARFFRTISSTLSSKG